MEVSCVPCCVWPHPLLYISEINGSLLLQDYLARRVTMNNAAGLLFAFLAVLVSCISLEKVLLQLMKKKKRTCRTSYFQQHWDSRGGVRCCRQTRSAVKQNSVTRYAAAEGSDLTPQPHPDPHVRWALCRGGSPCCLGSKLHVFCPAILTYLSLVKEALPFFLFS